MNTPANFSGPSKIIVKGGASALLWTIYFRENNKGIQFGFSNIEEGTAGREVEAPLETFGSATIRNWIVSNASGNAAHSWCEFTIPYYDPLNTSGLDPLITNLPIGFNIYSDYQTSGYSYYVTFINNSSTNYKYTIHTIGEIDRKGTFASYGQVMMPFEKGKRYYLTLEDNWYFTYEIDWYVSQF